LPPNGTVERAALIHREILQLAVLILVAIGAFLLTRAVAASNRDTNARDAAEWYRRGQQAMATGHVNDAIDSLRRATTKDGSDTRYMLALARALAVEGDADGARSVLVTLRESAPEDAAVNLQLAQLAAAQADVTEALRFYHNALDARWPVQEAGARREVHLELIRFLLTQEQAGRALSELLALSADLPDDAPLRLEVAQLFAKAGDNRHALEQFQEVLGLAPENGDALAGAGQAAFQLGEYPLAHTYLRRAPTEKDDVKNTREIVDLLLTHDPLAARLGSAERRRRLEGDFSYAQQRLSACLEQRPAGSSSDVVSGLQSEARTFEDQLKSPSALEQDTVEAGIDLITRIEHVVVQQCGPPTALDRALGLIGRQHGAEPR
jgi:tetratricopeptide (TPR) repeat protein